MKKLVVIALVLLAALSGFAADSLRVLSWEEYLSWVEQYHPVARQARLQPVFGQEQLRMARGNFDPLLYGNWYEKTFNQTGYYQVQNAGVVLPTALGVELSANYENNQGAYLNPERTVPNGGLVSAGVGINLGQGLLMDRQRAELRQAKIYAESSENDQNILLNRLYLEANQAFWNWRKAYEDLLVIREGLELAIFRYDAVRIAFIQGELPAIDTVEAFTQVQNRTWQLREMERRVYEQQQALSVFLWDENQRPILLATTTVPGSAGPQPWTSADTPHLVERAEMHPELQSLDFLMAHLRVEQRLKAEYLRPKLSVRYNLLSARVNNFPGETGFFTNDYQFGAHFAYPLFIRGARGDLNTTRLKIQETTLETDLRRAQVINRLMAEIYSYEQLSQQYRVYQSNLGALERLLEAERQRFRMGESSLFLVNARENALIDAQMVLNDLRARREIAHARVRWAAGIGWQPLE
jgi:outer membrane protein TolC